MDKYKEGVTQVLAEGENFEALWEIYGLYPTRRDWVFQIALDFFNDLEKVVLAGERGNEFKVSKESDNTYAGVYIGSSDWQGLFFFGIELLKKEHSWYIGIYFDNEFPKEVREELKVNAAAILPDSDGYTTGTDWLRFKYLGDLDSYDDVYRLLPSNRGAIIKEYAADLWDLAIKYRGEVDSWVLGMKTKKGT